LAAAFREVEDGETAVDEAEVEGELGWFFGDGEGR
jgi:hypothetical protein